MKSEILSLDSAFKIFYPFLSIFHCSAYDQILGYHFLFICNSSFYSEDKNSKTKTTASVSLSSLYPNPN